MLTRDYYVALLEKRASENLPDEAPGVNPPPVLDSAQVTTNEHNKNLADNREYLHGIFPNAGEVESNQSATMKKLFNNLPKDTITSNPLIKVAREMFFGAIESGGLMKTAAPIHREVAFSAFCDELEKIAALQTQNLAQVAAKNRVAMSRPAKAWDLSSPASAAGAGAKPSVPQGSGTSVHANGLLGRLGLK